MRTNLLRRRDRRTRRRGLPLLLALALAVILGGPLQPAAAGPGTPPAAPGESSDGSGGHGQDRGSSYRITLVTGDVAVFHVTADGRQAAWLQRTPGGGSAPDPQVFEQDGEMHLVPAEAAPYVSSGVLDDRLFNLSLLVAQGYHDAARDDLPILVTAPDGTSARQQSRRAPLRQPGVRTVRTLPSVDGVSVRVEKSRLQSVWDAVRGDRAARSDAARPRLAGAERIWLNARVQATLDVSVPQIGAPAAWEAGYNGSGVDVAVLDSGYDPTHPDLAGTVSVAKNFTEEADPPGETAVDGNGHGTHVAATIAGSGAASEGTRKGVAPGADLMVGKVLDSTGSGYESWIIAGMEWAAAEGAEVVNMSLGTPFASDGSDPLSQAVDHLTESTGTLFVASAGNTGPNEQTVSAPGAATSALTVGAVTKEDEPAAFSSRGPRVGDRAVKPEVVAPGVGIVAARAAGTSLGNLLDEHYTSLNGTSMAAPHVAGAAALLAQQHPDWSAGQLKARLVSTSDWLTGEPVTFQGAGRVDVAAAVANSVRVDSGVLSLGRVSRQDGLVRRTLTYHNPTDRTIPLRLTADVTGTGSQQNRRPELAISRRVLVVPAHGRATARVTLVAGRTEVGGYAGRIVARDVRTRDAVAHTAIAFAVEGAPRTVTVTALDRQGRPASGYVDLWNLDTGEWTRSFLDGGGAATEVPQGTYTVVAKIGAAGGWMDSTAHVIAGDPELGVHEDVSLHYDARDAVPVTVETPRDADLDSWDVLWHRTVGARSFSTVAAQGRYGEVVGLIPGPRAETGTFEVGFQWQLAEPQLTAQVSGSDGFRVGRPQLASTQRPYVGESTLPVVYAGDGTPEDFAQLDATGKVAVVSRRGPDQLDDQARAAHDAGAQVLLVHATEPGAWHETAWDAAVPTYRLSRAEGSRIRAALADDPDLRLDLVGIRDASYLYELTHTAEGRIPAGVHYVAGERPLATVTSEYREASERMVRREAWIPYAGSSGFAQSMSFRRNGPVVRTEYVSTDNVEWQRFAQPSVWLGLYWTSTVPEVYEPGESYHRLWWGPLVAPGVPPISGAEQLGMPVARFRDAIRVKMPHYWYGGTLRGTIFEVMGDSSELTLRRDGELVGRSSWSEGQFAVPAEKADYELRLQVANHDGHWSDTSVRTDTRWLFESARSGAERTVLPLLQVRYGLDAGPHNEVPAGEPYPLRLDPGYQPRATGPGGFTATVEVSYDDGASWLDAPVRETGDRLEATVPAAPGAGFATVRTVLTDADGNQLVQQIDRGWRIAAG